jgi:hypothetical protein
VTETVKMTFQALLPEALSPFILATSLALAFLVYTVVYRLIFHPLAKFPGPIWARLTVLPSWWHTRTGDRHVWLYSLQEKYGMSNEAVQRNQL